VICFDEFLAGVDIQSVLWRFLESYNIDTSAVVFDCDILETHLVARIDVD
jgi:hypothetical protein